MSQESEKTNGKTFIALTPEDQSKIDQGLTILARIIARDILNKRLVEITKIGKNEL